MLWLETHVDLASRFYRAMVGEDHDNFTSHLGLCLLLRYALDISRVTFTAESELDD